MKRHLENEAIKALRETLGQISVIRIKEIEVEDYRPRGERTIIARIAIYGHTHTLVCKIVDCSSSHDLQRAFFELTKLHERFPEKTTPVLIAPSLSEETQDICRKSDTGFLDLEGNARLFLDEVFIVKHSMRPRKTLPSQAETMPTCETARFAELAERAPGFLSQGGKH